MALLEFLSGSAGTRFITPRIGVWRLWQSDGRTVRLRFRRIYKFTGHVAGVAVGHRTGHVFTVGDDSHQGLVGVSILKVFHVLEHRHSGMGGDRFDAGAHHGLGVVQGDGPLVAGGEVCC